MLISYLTITNNVKLNMNVTLVKTKDFLCGDVALSLDKYRSATLLISIKNRFGEQDAAV